MALIISAKVATKADSTIRVSNYSFHFYKLTVIKLNDRIKIRR